MFFIVENFNSHIFDKIFTYCIIPKLIAGLNKFIRENRSTIFEYRIKALLAVPEVVGIIKNGG